MKITKGKKLLSRLKNKKGIGDKWKSQNNTAEINIKDYIHSLRVTHFQNKS